MAYTWEHAVAPEWLIERKAVVTATELISLLPELKRQKKKAEPDAIPAQCAALWGKKTSLDTSNIYSSGAAARGHIMEPYAVSEYNLTRPEVRQYHWDDAIICNDGIGWSPDATSVMQQQATAADERIFRWDVAEDALHMIGAGQTLPLPTSMLEIKSYGMEHHMTSIITDKMELKERMQLAVAMLVVPTLDTAHLMFYNPSARIGYKVYTYTREELEADITQLAEAAYMWRTAKAALDAIEPVRTIFDEADIWDSTDTL